MGIIQYSDLLFTLTVNLLNLRINAISTTPTEATPGESNVEAMKKFIELYGKIGEMMCEYKELLDLDQQALRDAGNEIKLQDLSISSLFR